MGRPEHDTTAVSTLRFLAEHDRPSGYLAWEVAYLMAADKALGDRTVAEVRSQLDDLARRGLTQVEVLDLRARAAIPRYRVSDLGRGLATGSSR